MRWVPLLLLLLLDLRLRAVEPGERIVVAPDGRTFVGAESRQPFHPWGMNYGNAGRLMEDFWEKDWDTIAGDFRELKALGANVVRVHLQFGKFMTAADQPNAAALDQLRRLLQLAAETDLRLDVTGLACYRPADVPAWYDALDEPARWSAQAAFWAAVAKTCAGSPSVFCYDLINEPLSPASARKPGEWRSGHLFGGYDFLQYIALDPAGRRREEIAAAWIQRMTTAIRQHDRSTLITVGLLPWSRQWQHLSGFLPATVAPGLDFISVHIYPERTKADEAMECLRQFALGKPIVIEETFPLSCDVVQLEEFLRASRELACGWIGHYDGAPLEELDGAKDLTIPQSIYRDWLRLFVHLTPEFSAPLMEAIRRP